MYSVVAYQFAVSIDLKRCRQSIGFEVVFNDSDELFVRLSDKKYAYVFQYGMVSFFNLSKQEIDDFFVSLRQVSKGVFGDPFSDAISVTVANGKDLVGFGQVQLNDFDSEAIRLVMLNASQSVALDRYGELTEDLLLDTNAHTKYLEQKGRLDIKGNKLKRYIGKTLNIKNQIAENLYIFDSPEVTWDNERLNRLNSSLKQTFDLKDRYRHIHDRLEIINENLQLFKDIMDHRESSRLEWIIIILIFVEVLDHFIIRLF
ncbi:RMD1 family protein [Allomuricauda sp. d1]|uniref:RMD1 family protein n=1 Tax=Allomuricauda sp. d1 TaxID=3136725 RepID=UPI0031D0D293